MPPLPRWLLRATSPGAARLGDPHSRPSWGCSRDVGGAVAARELARGWSVPSQGGSPAVHTGCCLELSVPRHTDPKRMVPGKGTRRKPHCLSDLEREATRRRPCHLLFCQSEHQGRPALSGQSVSGCAVRGKNVRASVDLFLNLCRHQGRSQGGKPRGWRGQQQVDRDALCVRSVQGGRGELCWTPVAG